MLRKDLDRLLGCWDAGMLAGFWFGRTRLSVRFLNFTVKVVRHTSRLWKAVEKVSWGNYSAVHVQAVSLRHYFAAARYTWAAWTDEYVRPHINLVELFDT